jgi:hypothetical protein
MCHTMVATPDLAYSALTSGRGPAGDPAAEHARPAQSACAAWPTAGAW